MSKMQLEKDFAKEKAKLTADVQAEKDKKDLVELKNKELKKEHSDLKEKYEKEKKTVEKTTKEANDFKNKAKVLEKDIKSQADKFKVIASGKDVKIGEIETNRVSEKKTADTNIREAKTETKTAKEEAKLEKAKAEAEIAKAKAAAEAA